MKMCEKNSLILENQEFFVSLITLMREGFCDQNLGEKFLPNFSKNKGIVHAIINAEKISDVLNHLESILGVQGSEDFLENLKKSNKQKLELVKGILKIWLITYF